MAAATAGATSITYTIDPVSGDMALAAIQLFPDGSSAPLVTTIPAYRVAMFYNLVVTFVMPSMFVVPGVSPPTDSDVARLIATVLTVFNSPPVPVTPTQPAPTSVPPVTITVG